MEAERCSDFFVRSEPTESCEVSLVSVVVQRRSASFSAA